MDHAAPQLKRLREQCRPTLSVRKLASLLGMAASSYVFYEDANKFKKRFIPVDLAHALVAPMSERGIDPADVLALAGIGASGVPVHLPPAQHTPVTMPVILPPVEALERGFLAVLMASRQMGEAALAHELAVQLPTLLSVLQGPLRMEPAPPAPAAAPADDYPAKRRA